MKDLLEKWMKLKEQEKLIKEEREQTEVEIYTLLSSEMNDESQSTWHYDDIKLVIKPNWTVSVDQALAMAHADLFKTKYEMSYSQYKKCQDKNTVDNIVSIKQTKPTFTIVRG